jgi:hypothetical protein
MRHLKFKERIYKRQYSCDISVITEASHSLMRSASVNDIRTKSC